MESYGNIGAKKIIIEKYKKVHSTKRAFKAEFEALKQGVTKKITNISGSCIQIMAQEMAMK